MRLYINIDHVATVRQARLTDEPDPVRAAVLAELGGADGITVHLREDRRHIQDRDVRLLMETVRTGVNLELAATSEIVALACELRPMQATLVPEKREEVTTEGGLALSEAGHLKATKAALDRLSAAGIRTSLFVDPDDASLRASVDLGVDAVELHTGEYANADPTKRTEQIARLSRAAALASKLSLAVHAGHGLTYENVQPVAAIPEIEELNIGHSVIARSVFTGLEAAVREMGDIVRRARATT
ncbi:MAG: pyridoxine 5'-phosphate synthase [Gemmatimonadota bacterium]|nr:pyridoxine 5'-phosphate synthase [Gemmatimonadota bacterium]MDH3422718.1 pyridoxine 5'-phosphate synthase [Gemmatimonadota bacterium]